MVHSGAGGVERAALAPAWHPGAGLRYPGQKLDKLGAADPNALEERRPSRDP